MQLDKTGIAVRERDWLEVLDLALQVMRRFVAPILLAGLVGILPMMLLNNWLLGDLIENEQDVGGRWTYAWWLPLVVLIEMPLATAPITLYLGHALFLENARPRQLARQFFSSLPQLLLLQVLPRFFLTLIVVLAWLPFAFWPYLNEIILLERNPLRTRSTMQLSTRQRSKALHGASSGELFGRGVINACFAAMLIVVLWLSFWYLHGLLTEDWEFGRTMFMLYFQGSVWLVAVFFTVARFLTYLDLRIRREGWEIELLMRAERTRMARQLS